MKSISDDEKNKINAIHNEIQPNINISALEKDIHITELINHLSKLEFDDFSLVFCGGTCLSKSYGILERMSEDVDFKLVLKEDKNFSKNELKNKLSTVKHIIKDTLINLDYISVEDVEKTGSTVLKARDSNQYIAFDIPYYNKFPQSSVLRSHIQIELNYTKLQLDVKKYPVGYIYDEYFKKSNIKLDIKCISLEEAFCEKLISFPRRLSHAIANNKLSEFDQALVRHLYDIHQIKQKHPNIDKDETLINGLMKNLILKDAVEFSNQHQQFVADPIGELNKAMISASESIQIRKNYSDFLEHMVYQDADEKPSFDTVISTFNVALKNAINNLSEITVQVPVKDPVAVIKTKRPSP